MTDARTRSIAVGVPTLVGVAGFAGVVGVGAEPWQIAVSGLLAAVLAVTDVVRGRPTSRDRARIRGLS